MGFFKNLFGKKESEENVDIEVSWGDEPELAEDDYQYVHTFIFYCLNEDGFNTISREVENHDGPQLLSLLRNQSGVLMFDFPSIDGDSDEYTKMGDIDWKAKFKDWMEMIPQQFVSEELGNEELGEAVVKVLNDNRDTIYENIAEYALEYWHDTDHFNNKEDFIPAMVVAFKSSKLMDLDDGLSENQNGMNLVLTDGNGWLKTCSYAMKEQVNLDQEKDVVALMDYWDQNGDRWGVEEIKPKSVLLIHWDTDTYCDH